MTAFELINGHESRMLGSAKLSSVRLNSVRFGRQVRMGSIRLSFGPRTGLVWNATRLPPRCRTLLSEADSSWPRRFLRPAAGEPKGKGGGSRSPEGSPVFNVREPPLSSPVPWPAMR